MNELSTTAATELARREANIERSLQTCYVEVGTELRAIRDERLYLETHDTFEAYCRQRWRWGRHYANRQILAAEVASNLVPIGTIPATESQARPLTSLAPDQQREAWREAISTAPGGKITTAHVNKVVKARYVVRQPAATAAGILPQSGGIVVQGDAERLEYPDRSFDLVFGSPPYMDARLYLEDGEDWEIARGCREWIDWMMRVSAEAMRVSKGLVCWVVGGKTRDHCYQPAPEGLAYEWWKRGGHLHRPIYWYRSGTPGSGNEQWMRWDVDPVLCFKRPGELGYRPDWCKIIL